MTGGPELEALAGRLRARAAEGRYPQAQEALAAYCTALGRAAAALAPGDPARRRLRIEGLGLLEETRRRVLAARAHSAARLVRLAGMPGGPRSYGDRPPARSRSCWVA